ncbi:MAG TPA: hypothetical protein VN774_05640 [Candidatus Limnocylindrales bacterium]|nr:hypothetical protein [Candidatus Limnocylindrales bacterium]
MKVVFNSVPVEITTDSVVLDVKGSKQRIPNDFVWIFAGGEPPSAFLKKIGVAVGSHDLTKEGSKEVQQTVLAETLA